jgi:uncharacterized protein YdhG (YjbR/CyaY superfamily)
MANTRTASTKRRPLAQQDDASEAVDKYLAAVPEPARGTLETMRATIRSAMPPAATEGIGYGIPMFRHEEVRVYFAAFSKHCSFFPGSMAVLAAFKDELKDYPTSKGTIRFPPDKPLSSNLLKRMVKARIAENKRKQTRKQ